MKKDTLFILLGVGVILFLTSKSSAASTFVGPTQYPPPGGNLSTNPFSSLFSSLTNLFTGGTPTYDTGTPVTTTSNPAYSNINAGPGTGTPGAYDSGDPCDPASVQYNPDICAEL